MLIVASLADKVKGQPGLKRIYTQTKTRINTIIDKARNLSHMLMPLSLKFIGLAGSIKILVETLNIDKKLSVKLTHKNINKFTSEPAVIAVYRIVQEALNNIIKHAQATRVIVTMTCPRDSLVLTIVDNGRGFDRGIVKNNQGLGLTLMCQRAQLINGTLDIVSRLGKGTTVKLKVPIQGNKKL
jgi:signal transduction histidine kinase